MAAETTDAELLDAWRAGDAAAGEALFGRTFDVVFRFFRTKTPADASDLVQATFLGVVEGRDRIRDGASVRAYILGVAHNQLLMYFRARAKDARLDFSTSSLLDLGPSPSELTRRESENEIVARALTRIPLDLQIAVELYYLEELSGPEVAEVLGVPEGTARSRVRRGIDALRAILEETPSTPEDRQSSLQYVDLWSARLGPIGLGSVEE